MENIVPIKFKPVLKEVLWGTDRFKELFGRTDIEGPVGECWLGVDTDVDQSVVEGGASDGKTFREFLETEGEKYGFAPVQCEKYYNLLNKYIDTNDALSVQVHPNKLDSTCPQFRPKDECWYVIDAQEGAFVYAGLKDGVTREQMAAAVETGTTSELLQTHEAKPGDIFMIPAGMVHALGKGLLVAEIGTRSTTTFRLFDWNRVDKNGNGRELHIEQSLESIVFDPEALKTRIVSGGDVTAKLMETANQMGTGKTLVDCQFFTVAEITAKAGKAQFTPTQPLMVYQVSGSSKIYSQAAADQAIEMKLGSAVIYPANVAGEIEFDSDSIVLITTPGTEKY